MTARATSGHQRTGGVRTARNHRRVDDNDDALIPDEPEKRYYLLAAQINHLLDRGESPAAEEIDDRIFDGTLFDWIEQHYRVKLRLQGYDRAMALGAFKALATTHPNTRPRFGVSRNGLCVLVAYCLEVMREPITWEDPQDDPSFPRV
jgi:hypothetical protein